MKDRDNWRVRVNVVRSLVTIFVIFAVASWITPVAGAQIAFSEVGVSLTESGQLDRQAGSHPDFTTKVRIADGTTPNLAGESVRDLSFDLPPGLIGNPTTVPECGFDEFDRLGLGASACPVESQVGEVHIATNTGGPSTFVSGLFNLVHPPDVPALFGFNYIGTIVLITPEVRPGDYGITASGVAISQGQPVSGVEVSLWGVPADPSHDAAREFEKNRGFPSASPVAPFMRAPTNCPGSTASFEAQMNSWENPGLFAKASFDTELGTETPFLFEGCETLPFGPSISVEPTSRTAGSPTGLNVQLQIPQNTSPYGLATSDLRQAVITLPPGMTVSASSASGLGACGPAEIGIGSNAPTTCPESSKIGRVTIHTPLLKEPLEGDVILAKQRDNPFGSLLALYLAVPGPGVYLKLPGKVETDRATGQLTVSFSDTPQLPFEELSMELDSGPRAPLVNPSTCGNFSAEAEFLSWSGTPAIHGQSSMTINQGCATEGFKPGFAAGTTKPAGGSFSPFVLQVTRQDGESNLSKIKATLPPGLLAKLAGVPLCGDAQATTGNCPAASQVGTTTVGAGAGSNPLYVPEAGKAPTAVYLGGPYKGAPYSLIVKVPAQAGPFDLGTVVVRNALRIDPVTTQVTTESDPLPQILEGIPISYRDVRVEINRPEFTVNPTNCSQFQVAGTLTSASGQTASPKAPFAAANCEGLGFKPSIALRLSGAPTRRGASPALTATLKPLKGDANLSKASVVLPPTELLEQSHIRTTCTRVQFAANQCPAKSIYGKAKAWTPLLDQPLEGPVYLRSNGGERQLPDLVADLNGSIHVVLVGYIDSVKRGGTPRIRSQVRLGAGRSGQQIRVGNAEGQEEPARQQHEPLQGEASRRSRAERPERQGTDDEAAGLGRRLRRQEERQEEEVGPRHMERRSPTGTQVLTWRGDRSGFAVSGGVPGIARRRDGSDDRGLGGGRQGERGALADRQPDLLPAGAASRR